MKKSSYWTILFVAIALAILPACGKKPHAEAPPQMTAQTATVPAHVSASECPYTFASWNIANLGKHNTSEQFAVMAKVLRNADIVAVQEVTARKGSGAKAVATLADELSRTGAAWDYIVSDATLPDGTGVERYAFLFKKNVVSVNRNDAHLVTELQESIDREPFTLTFHLKGGADLRVFTIHTVPTVKGPMREVIALAGAKEVQSAARAIVAGDFNLGPNVTDRPFAEAGYAGNIREHTSLRRVLHEDGKYLLTQYDNIYAKGVHVCTSGVIDFVSAYFSPVTEESLARARGVSDHLPVFATFK